MSKKGNNKITKRIPATILVAGLCITNAASPVVYAADSVSIEASADRQDTSSDISGISETQDGSSSSAAGDTSASSETDAKDSVSTSTDGSTTVIDDTETAKASGVSETDSETDSETKTGTDETAAAKTLLTSAALTADGTADGTDEEDRSFDDSKTDVWDFSAADHGDDYNNRMTATTINNIRPDIADGTTGTYFGSFSLDDGDFVFSSTGNSNYIRAKGASFTRTDDSYLQNNGTYYNGYLYNNSGAGDSNYIGIRCRKGDVITLTAGAVSGNSITYTFAAQDGSDQQSASVSLSGSVTADTMTFTAAGTGLYKIYSTDNKFAIAVITRQHAVSHTVSGNITAPAALSSLSYSLSFTDRNDSSSSCNANVTGGTYSVSLLQGHTYDIAVTGAAGTYTLQTSSVTVSSADQTLDLTILSADQPVVYGNGKTDVWDFGASALDTGSFNNLLTASVINSFYTSASAPVSADTGNVIGSFSLEDSGFSFVAGGAVHRLRTTNSSLTRYDEKQLRDKDGNVYPGYLYSNVAGTQKVYFEVTCMADDQITVVAGSNGSASDIVFENKTDTSDRQTQTHDPATGATATVMTFTADKAGTYKIYSANEKLVVARIERTHAAAYPVSGTVTAPASLRRCSVLFTNQTTGNTVSAEVTDGSYSCRLPGGFTYDVSLIDTDGSPITDHIITGSKTLTVKNEGMTADFTVTAIDMASVTGKLTGIEGTDLAAFIKKAAITFKPESDTTAYVPELKLSADGSYTLLLEKGITYDLTLTGTDSYELAANTMTASADGQQNIELLRKGTWPVTVTADGCSTADLSQAVFTFTRLDDTYKAPTDYIYSFTGTEGISLVNGTYHVTVTFPDGSIYRQKSVQDITVGGAAAQLTVNADTTAYRSIITVGADGCEYTTINDALNEVKAMQRDDATQRVTLEIQPGNYEEMLVIDEANVFLKNASSTPSIATTDSGAGIAADAVRITSYYGHGYTYYSMGKNCKYDADTLASNKMNGSASYTNPGAGTTNGSYWNATVVVSEPGFEADGIIFENSFNQYVSPKAAADTIVAQSGQAKEGDTSRASLPAGSTKVQEKAYVERAAALAMTASATGTWFNNCRIIGRQDTLYGAVGSTDAFYHCDVYGGTDYIFGGMSAVFAQSNLVMNTSDDKNDVAYITAAQTQSGSRGYLMYKCNITSAVPGVDTASAHTSKPGYFGRPWSGQTAEVVYYGTKIGTTSDWHYDSTKNTFVLNEDGSSYSPVSLINPAGWLAWSGSTVSDRFMEALSTELSGTDNLASRVSWAHTADTAVCADGTQATAAAFLGSDPFSARGIDIDAAQADPVTPVTPVTPAAPVTPSSDTGSSSESSESSSDTSGIAVPASVKAAVLGKKRALKAGWLKIGKAKYYVTEDGRLATGLTLIGKKTYCFNADGTLATGLQQIAGKVYFINKNGTVLKNKMKKINGRTFYFGKDGSLTAGLVKIGKKTYYFTADGMQTGWQKINGVNRYFAANGVMNASKSV